MGDHDQPYYGTIEQVSWFCINCRKMYYFIYDANKQIEEHKLLETRIERYVGSGNKR